jgi:hypothetical protein
LHTSRAVQWLTSLVALLALITSAAGLFSRGGDGPRTVTSIRGEDVELSGVGLYRYDTVFMAEGSRGTDAVTLVLGVPLLLAALVTYRRRSLRGGLLLAGALSYFLYVYASRSLYNAYNGMFLLYIAAFSASLYGLVLAVGAVDRASLTYRLSAGKPRRDLAGFLLTCGVATSAVWLLPLVGSIASGEAPKLLDSYSTSVTDVLDLGLIVPTLFMAATLVLRREALGYVFAAALIVLLVLTAATIIIGTVFQIAGGVTFTPGEVVGPISGFLVLAAIGVALLARLLRDIGGSVPPRAGAR